MVEKIINKIQMDAVETQEELLRRIQDLEKYVIACGKRGFSSTDDISEFMEEVGKQSDIIYEVEERGRIYKDVINKIYSHEQLVCNEASRVKELEDNGWVKDNGKISKNGIVLKIDELDGLTQAEFDRYKEEDIIVRKLSDLAVSNNKRIKDNLKEQEEKIERNKQVEEANAKIQRFKNNDWKVDMDNLAIEKDGKSVPLKEFVEMLDEEIEKLLIS